MLTILNNGQDFEWANNYYTKFVSSFQDFVTAASPKIVLVNSANNWYSSPRGDDYLTIYWVTEALANERAEGKPIVKLHSNDRIFSSSNGPNNNFNLLYWFAYIQSLYINKYKYLIPTNEIYANNLCCTLGQGRIFRIYLYYALQKYRLINRNVSFSTNDFLFHALPDQKNELPGQKEIVNFLSKQNHSLLKTKPLELDWRKIKNHTNWWGQHRPGIQTSAIIPTHAYLDSSLILITETIMHNPEFFVTEKTIKGLLSGRPCIILGCYKFLEHLRNLGFLTWSSVLDESYDERENIKDRIDCAVLSANYFITANVLNNKKALQKIQYISDHNKKVFFETNWKTRIELAKKQILIELGII